MHPTPRSESLLRQHAGKLVASAFITASFAYALKKGGLAIWPGAARFRDVRWWTVGVYFVTLAAMSWFRALRWRFLLRPIAQVPPRKVLAVSWIGFAAILLLPFRLGEFVRPLMIRDTKKLTMAAATGTVLAERIIDGLFLSLLLAVTLVLVPCVHPLPDRVGGLKVPVAAVRDLGFVVFAVFAAGFVTICIFYFARGWAHRITMKVFGVFPAPLPRVGEKLAGMVENFADGLHFLGHGRAAGGFLAETTLYWLLNAAGMWLLGWGCGVVHADGSAMTFPEACAIMGMLGVMILVPGPPGLFGTFQAGIYYGMAMYFPLAVVTDGAGTVYVFLLYAAQVLWTLGAAAAFLLFDRGAFRTLEHAAEDAQTGAGKLAEPGASA